ncbi:MAG: LPS assembly lipoprotein LptE [Arenicellales bacterium]
MTRRLLLILTCFSLVSGCGFHLRGNVDIPDSLTTMAVSGKDPDLVDELEDALESAGVNVTNTEDKSAAVLLLTQTDYEREVRTTDASGLATSYDLRYRIGYDVLSGSGDELQINQRIVQKRVFEYDPLLQLQSEEEEEFLREDMRKEIVLQILRRLSRI